MSKETKKNETESKTPMAMLTAEGKAAEARAMYLRDLISQTEKLVAEFMQTMRIDLSLTGTDRRRLTGSGVRNNGFIDKAA